MSTAWDDLRKFIKEKKTAVLLAYGLTLALFGMWLFHHVVTFDAEGLYSIAAGKKWYSQWVDIGRWAMVVLKKVLGAAAINPYFSTAIFLTGFPFSALLWLYLLEKWNGASYSFPAEFLFLGVYLTHPIWALQFAYRNQMETITIVMLLVPAALYFAGRAYEERSVWRGIFAFLLTAFCFSSYQGFIFLFFEGVAIRLYYRMRKEEVGTSAFWKEFAASAVFSVAAFVFSYLTNMISRQVIGLTKHTSYLSSQFQWLSGSFSEHVFGVLHTFRISLLGDGDVYTPLLMAETILLICYLAVLFRKKAPYRRRAVLVCAGILGFPFLLEVATASAIVSRSRFAFVLCAAFLAMEEFSFGETYLSGKWNRAAVQLLTFAVFVLVLVPQAQMETRLLYTDIKVMDEDRTKLEEIYYEALRLGAKPGDTIVFAGGQANDFVESMVEYEVIGYSYLEHPVNAGSIKVADAMRAYGLNVAAPTKEEMAYGVEEAKSLAIWPLEGSILVKDGMIIVRLS